MSSPVAPAPAALPPELEPLLTPIAAPHPGGVELRYDPVYDQIKEARREDDDVPQGEWATERKTADWPAVLRLTTQALTSRSKDLQLAAWLTEAKLRKDGPGGLRAGLVLLRELVERFWEHLYPEIDDGDAEFRAAPLEWLARGLDLPLRRVALTRDRHDLIGYRESRLVPTETDAAEDEAKAERRATAIREGRLLPEEFDKSFAATPKPFYKQLVADLDGCLEALAALAAACDARFGDVSPNFAPLQESLEDLRRTARQLLARKLETDPDPVESAPAAEAAAPLVDMVMSAAAAHDRRPAAAGGAMAAPSGGPEPASREDAAARVAVAARWLRRADPCNPAPYLLLRGLRWGELRAAGADPDPRLLEAPTTAVRTRLKGLLLDRQWPELLEAAEEVMATPQGRGWLDLQRYALTACDALGGEYRFVGDALRGALRGLLAELPRLVEMTLMDDTPTANAETRAWLREVAPASATEAAADEPAPLARPRDPGAVAAAEVRAGRPERAIALLMREVERERTVRARFLLQTEMARVMVDAGHFAVAFPVLEELMKHVDEHRLEEWEAGELVAQPFALMFRCLRGAGVDEERQQALYLRLCRLDPLAAMSITAGSAPAAGEE